MSVSSPGLSERARRDRQRGSAAVVAAAGMAALVGLAALVADVGRLYVVRARLAGVADAAALAGAALLPDDPDGAVATAARYVEANGVPSRSAEITPYDGNRRLRVALAAEEPLFLARVMGFAKARVSAVSVATRQVLSGVRGAVPFGVPEGTYRYGELVTLKGDAGSGPVSPGNFRALALGGRGASRYEDNIRHGYDGWLRIGDTVETEPGVMAGPTRRGVEARISADPDSEFNEDVECGGQDEPDREDEADKDDRHNGDEDVECGGQDEPDREDEADKDDRHNGDEDVECGGQDEPDREDEADKDDRHNGDDKDDRHNGDAGAGRDGKSERDPGAGRDDGSERDVECPKDGGTIRPGSPRVVVVPIVGPYPNGRGKVRIVAFGVFFLEGSDGKEITGRFLRLITSGEGADDAPDYGAGVVRLVR